MKIISFAWTTPAVIAGEKCVTRRDWDERYASRFKQGDQLQAWDKSPRFGGRCFGTVELVREPYREKTCDAPEVDYLKEGFVYLQRRGVLLQGKYTPQMLWKVWKNHTDIEKWVVRFKVIRLDEMSCADIMKDCETKYGPVK